MVRIWYEPMLDFLTEIFLVSGDLLLDASVYILLGIFMGGLLKVFLSPSYISRHLGSGRFSSVFKAAFLGIPIPICSCGVLPVAATLKKQGANRGATMAFLISTPESGVDSISITYALLDPIMTIARPVAAFISAVVAGVSENLWKPAISTPHPSDFLCPVDSCSSADCGEGSQIKHHTLFEKISAGLRYAVNDVWDDIAGWFFLGLLLAGVITVIVPDEMIFKYLGGGLPAMLLMLVVGIPLYICATASTPIAAALLLKGISPGAALVFLLVGPATNITSLSVLIGILGKRATVLYLVVISVVSVSCGLVLDQVYSRFGISVHAVVGHGGEIVPYPMKLTGALLILLISIKPLGKIVKGLWVKKGDGCGCDGGCKG